MKKSLLLAAALLMLDGSAYAQSPSPYQPTNEFRNMLVCGDATICPWQRGTSIGSIGASGVMTADYWEAIGGASSNITISKAAQTGVNGFTQAIQFQRTAANTDTAALHLGQVLDSADYGTSLQGKTVCLSFLSYMGANFSAVNAAFTAKIYSGTGTNQGYASMVAATWTGQVTVSTINVTATTLGQGTEQCAQIPANATEVGIDFSFVPGGTAGASDYIQLQRVQFEQTAVVPVAAAKATPFENRSFTNELWLAQQRAYVIAEPGTNRIVALGNAQTSTQCDLFIQFPRSMRAAPGAVTASAITGGTTWQAFAAGLQANLTAIAQLATGSNTTLGASLTATTSGMTAGQTCGLVGKGGGASLIFSADLT